MNIYTIIHNYEAQDDKVQLDSKVELDVNNCNLDHLNISSIFLPNTIIVFASCQNIQLPYDLAFLIHKFLKKEEAIVFDVDTLRTTCENCECFFNECDCETVIPYDDIFEYSDKPKPY